MRVWIDPDRLAALNLSPGDVHAALRRNNYLAAVGQTKGNLVQVNLLANTDLRSVDEFENLIVADAERRDRAPVATWRGSSSAPRRPTSSRSSTTRKAVYLGGLAARRRRTRSRWRTACAPRWSAIRPTLPKDIDMRLAYDGTVFMEDALEGDHARR